MKQGWEECILEDYIKLIDYRGRTPVKTESGIRLITAKNVKLGYLQIEPQEFIAKDNYESWMTRGIPNFGDVIFTTEAPLANVAQIDTYDKVAFAQRIIVMQPQKDKIDSTFLKFLLLSDSTRRKILEKGTGATVLGIKSSLLKKIKISIPSISEQQRIVSILDTAFEAIDKAKANAEQNLKNSKELFESYLQEVLENGDWEEKTLGQLSKNKDAVVSGPFGSNLKVSDYKTEGIPILRLQNIGKGYFINKSIKYITRQKAEELKYHSFVSGDIALAKLGIPIGKTCIIPENFKSGIITADIVRIRPDLQVVNYKFLVNFLNTNLSVSQLTGNISGATRPRVNLSDVRNIVIKLPSIKEQENIVKKLDSLLIETKKLETIYQTKINDLEELKKSLLEKAFKGELKTEKIELA
jgi:type I restriction enzyme S subunit